MIDLAGAAGVPATKLFGRSPEGMNATGESDLTNYYDMIAQEQEAKLRPILNKLLPVMCMSTFGAVPDDLDFEFDPVSEPSDKDRSDLAKSQAENVVTVFNAGLISARTALKELKQQGESIGAWSNISDEDIQKASDEVEPAGEMGGFPGMGVGMEGRESEPEPRQQAQPHMQGIGDSGKWVEEDHPRDEGGRFTSGGGGASVKEDEHPRASNGKFPKCSGESTVGKGYNNKQKYRNLSKEPMVTPINASGRNKFPEWAFKNHAKAKNHYYDHQGKLQEAGIYSYEDYLRITKEN